MSVYTSPENIRLFVDASLETTKSNEQTQRMGAMMLHGALHVNEGVDIYADGADDPLGLFVEEVSARLKSTVYEDEELLEVIMANMTGELEEREIELHGDFGRGSIDRSIDFNLFDDRLKLFCERIAHSAAILIAGLDGSEVMEQPVIERVAFIEDALLASELADNVGYLFLGRASMIEKVSGLPARKNLYTSLEETIYRGLGISDVRSLVERATDYLWLYGVKEIGHAIHNPEIDSMTKLRLLESKVLFRKNGLRLGRVSTDRAFEGLRAEYRGLPTDIDIDAGVLPRPELLGLELNELEALVKLFGHKAGIEERLALSDGSTAIMANDSKSQKILAVELTQIAETIRKDPSIEDEQMVDLFRNLFGVCPADYIRGLVGHKDFQAIQSEDAFRWVYDSWGYRRDGSSHIDQNLDLEYLGDDDYTEDRERSEEFIVLDMLMELRNSDGWFNDEGDEWR